MNGNTKEIERLANEADKLGLSYGQYVSQLKQKKEKSKKKSKK
jgi:hypothetical protein